MQNFFKKYNKDYVGEKLEYKGKALNVQRIKKSFCEDVKMYI